MPTSRSLSELASSFRQRRLLVVVEGEIDEVADYPWTLVERALSAALAAGVADAAVESGTSPAGELWLALRLRAIDRSIAIDFAKRLDISSLRRELEESGGRLLKAHSRFAVFHLEMTFSGS